jgi:aminomethyltransferase
MADELLRSPLHSRHVALEAQMTESAGWLMPLAYAGLRHAGAATAAQAGVLEELAQVRKRAGLWDVSHMGRLRIGGDGALDLLEHACTADVAHQEDDTCITTLLCNDRGGIIDMCQLARMEDHWLMVTSPLARVSVMEHLSPLAQRFGARLDDHTFKTTMIDVAGPAAAEILDTVLPVKPTGLPAGAARGGSFMIARYTALRANYTGLWSLAVVLPNLFSGKAWDYITAKAGDKAITPMGLAARDVLRVEAGLPAFGNELNQTIDPITAGLEAAVDSGHEFIGADAIRQIKARGPARKRVGLVLDAGRAYLPDSPGAAAEGRASMPDLHIPRQGTGIYLGDGAECGTITSGAYSLAMDKIIAMAYVSPDMSATGTRLLVGPNSTPATVAPLPIYLAS